MSELPEFLNGYLVDDRIWLFSRDAEGVLRRRQVPAEWACFVRAADVDERLDRMLRKSAHVARFKREGDWVRICWKGYDTRKAVLAPKGWFDEQKIPTFEGDVSPLRRWFADNGASVAKPRRCYLDIETDSRVPPTKAREGEARILCWCVEDAQGNVVQGLLQEDTDAAERELLNGLWTALEPFDQIASWFGDGFDFPVIRLRSKFLRPRVKDPKRWLYVDQLAVYERMNVAAESGDEKESLALKRVQHNHLGKLEGDDELLRDEDFDARGSWGAWFSGEEGCQRLLEYNRRDTRRQRRIEEETGFLDILFELSRIASIFPDTYGTHPVAQVDGYVLRQGITRGQHFATRMHRGGDQEEEKYKGALVIPPTRRGIVKGVHVFDFSGMYPSIILSFNMSPETKRDVIFTGPVPAGMARTPTTRKGFLLAPRGIISEALDEILRLKDHWGKRKAELPPGTIEWIEADRKATAYKVASNSFYGVLGSPFSRFFDRDIAEGVTQTGVWLIKETLAAALREQKMATIYGDTDSGFVAGTGEEEVRKFVAWANATLYPMLLAECGVPPEQVRVKLAYEKEFERIVFSSNAAGEPTKKRYCNPLEAPILMGDFSFREIGDVRVGDVVVGWVDGTSRRKRHMRPSRVGAVHRHEAMVVRVTMSSGMVIRCTPDHQWLRARLLKSDRGAKFYEYPWCDVRKGRKIVRVLEQPRELPPALQRDADWLGGIFDGEGSLSNALRNQIVISQSRRVNPEVCKRIEDSLNRLGFAWSVHPEKGGACDRYAIKGGKQARLNFLTWCRPAKFRPMADGLMRSFFGNAPDEIVSIEEDGIEEVVGLTTETGNYIAWGFASKNCGRYAHYKGKRATADSKPEVKGLEWKRGDASKIARSMQYDVIRLLMGYDVGQQPRPKGAEKNAPAPLEGYGDGTPCEDVEAFQRLVQTWRKYILEEALPVGLIRVTKGLSRPLSGYVTKQKADGTDGASPPHVRVARMLAARGYDLGEGSKIDYIVIDGEAKPLGVIPAVDYTGIFDRHYMWEKQVYPATMRLLIGAFPESDWEAYGSSRPPTERQAARAAKRAEKEAEARGVAAAAPAPETPAKGPVRGRKGKAKPVEQQSLFGGGAAAPLPPPASAASSAVTRVTASETGPLKIEIKEADRDEVELLRDALADHPGGRRVLLERMGVFDEEMSRIVAGLRVSGSPEMWLDVTGVLP